MIALALALALAAAPARAPQRIVSNNPCIDAMLRAVAHPHQIAAISHYSQSPRSTSVPLAWAARYRAIGDTAEEVILARPDLFVTGAPMPLATSRAVVRARVPLLSLGIAASIADSKRQVTTLAAAVGNPAAGVALNARIDAAVAAATWRGPRVAALIRQGGGLVPGSGTLADELLRVAGFANARTAFGLKAWDVLPLEPMRARPPAIVLTPIAQAPRIARLRVRVADFPESMLFCAGPTIIHALDRLAAIRRGL